MRYAVMVEQTDAVVVFGNGSRSSQGRLNKGTQFGSSKTSRFFYKTQCRT